MTAPNSNNPKLLRSFEVVLETLCIVICADQRTTQAERDHIVAKMLEFGAPWSVDEVENRVQQIVRNIRKGSMSRKLRDICDELPGVINETQGKTLLDMIDEAAMADGRIDEREQRVRNRIASVLSTSDLLNDSDRNAGSQRLVSPETQADSFPEEGDSNTTLSIKSTKKKAPPLTIDHSEQRRRLESKTRSVRNSDTQKYWSAPTTLLVAAVAIGGPVWMAYATGYGHLVKGFAIISAILGVLALIMLLVMMAIQASDGDATVSGGSKVFLVSLVSCMFLGALAGHGADVTHTSRGSGSRGGVRVKYYSVSDRTRGWDEYWSDVGSGIGWGTVTGVVIGFMAVGYFENEDQ